MKRTRLNRISAKKLAANGGRIPFSTLAPRSEKATAAQDYRNKVLAPLLFARQEGLCFARWSDECTVNLEVDRKGGRRWDIHELLRRAQGGSVVDEDNCRGVCRPCHKKITRNPDEAIKRGFSVSSSPELHVLKMEMMS